MQKDIIGESRHLPTIRFAILLNFQKIVDLTLFQEVVNFDHAQECFYLDMFKQLLSLNMLNENYNLHRIQYSHSNYFQEVFNIDNFLQSDIDIHLSTIN